MPSRIKVIAFDLFGTVFDMAGVPKDELRHYGETIRDPVWRPFEWPESWETLPEFDDSREGMLWLMEFGYRVVALSNAPLALTVRMSRNEPIVWDAIIPLETIKTYKPNVATYKFACDLLQCDPQDLLMVSANKDFGDIENAVAAGCKSQLVRHDGCPKDFIALANKLNNEGRP